MFNEYLAYWYLTCWFWLFSRKRPYLGRDRDRITSPSPWPNTPTVADQEEAGHQSDQESGEELHDGVTSQDRSRAETSRPLLIGELRVSDPVMVSGLLFNITEWRPRLPDVSWTPSPHLWCPLWANAHAQWDRRSVSCIAVARTGRGGGSNYFKHILGEISFFIPMPFYNLPLKWKVMIERHAGVPFHAHLTWLL